MQKQNRKLTSVSISIPVSLAALVGLASYTIFACLCRSKHSLLPSISILLCFPSQPHFISSTTDVQMEKVGLKSFSLVNVHHLKLKAKHQSLYTYEYIICCAQEQVGLQRGSSLHRRPTHPSFCPPS